MIAQHQHSRNSSFSNNWQSKRCDFCMYHDLIFDQLEKLKQAVIMKNQRIKELEDFIGKMSQMAFMKNPTIPSSGQLNGVFIPKSTEMIEDESSSLFLNSPNDSKNFMFKRKFEEQTEISFQDMRLNPGKFEVKQKQSPDFMSRFQKIKELNEIKKQLDKQILETADKENYTFSNRIESFNNSRQYDTIRTLSEPQQEGHIGSIDHENSSLREFDQRKTRFLNMDGSMSCERDNGVNQILKKSNSFEDKGSLNIIKNYIKRLQ